MTDYAPPGKLRRRPDRWDTSIEGAKVRVQGAPIPRPFAMVECFRRAYKEAKKIYKGLSPSTCVPEGEEAAQEAAPFHVRVVKSMQQYYNAHNR